MKEYSEEDFIDGQPPTEDDEAKLYREQLCTALDVFGLALSTTRATAIDGRQSSGIEEIWKEDEEYYEGIDDVNRGDAGLLRNKATGTMQQNNNDGRTKPSGSSVFPNITRPYVDAASARTADILLPTDDVSWSIEPTPVPELIGMAEGKVPRHLQKQVVQALPGQPEAQQQMLAKAVQQATEQVKMAREAANAASDQIRDWQIESQFHSVAREQLEDAAKVGTGIIKGPVPAVCRSVAMKDGNLLIVNEIKPVSKRTSYWNFYPDPSCGDDIHAGNYTWERDDITARSLKDLIGTPGYIEEQINKCLEEGPHEACKISNETDNAPPGLRSRITKDLYEIWYYYGVAKREDYLAAVELRADAEEFKQSIDQNDLRDSVFVVLTMVNNHVICMEQNPLDTGDFPYDVMVWQRRKNFWAGIGVARQIRVAQNIVKGGFRAMMDNAGAASGPQVIFDQNAVIPQNGVYEFVPWKLWMLTKPVEGQSGIDNVFRFIKTEMYQAELQGIIELGMRLAEDATGLPMIMQGQTSSQTPDTLGGMQLQNQNASTVLRRIARLYDDLVTEPHIRRYYQYLMMYGPDECKGDFKINAMGSSALVERDIQAQALLQWATIVNDPTFGIDKKKWAEEAMKSQKLDYNRFKFDDEEWEALLTQLAQQAESSGGGGESQVAVAQLRAENALQLQQMKEQGQNDRLQLTQQWEGQFRQAEQELEALKLNLDKVISDDGIKSDISRDLMKLKAQLQLGMNKQVADAAAEPPGKAPSGQGFTK